MMSLNTEIQKLKGPILILGASGFIGANLFHMLSRVRSDVWGIASTLPCWRIIESYSSQLIQIDFLSNQETINVLDKTKANTIFDCIAYGGYSFEKDLKKIYNTNLISKIFLIEELIKRKVCAYIHAGSSSEYGINANGPSEESMPTPNSHYAVTKSAIANMIYYAGKHQEFRTANLRFYSAYGPWEDPSRLIPTLIKYGLNGELPPLVNADTSRDFVYIDDVCKAFIHAANNLSPENYGESFNIGTGYKTTIREIAALAKKNFDIPSEPIFSIMPSRQWDTTNWYANANKAKALLKWEATTSLQEGFLKTIHWYKSFVTKYPYEKFSKQFVTKNYYNVSAIVACYQDAKAIPIMVQRLKQVFEKCHTDYEIILVNDDSPDDTEFVIQSLSHDSKVIGITHARNFGSQAAFKSGMQLASKNACVLLDGDLQDPPELIEQFIEQWQNGYDVVYGIRVKREAGWLMQVSYKVFYRLFNWFSPITIPYDAGDFSLMDKRVVQWLLACDERDLFLRGLRAYVGFKQTGINYIRPERMFGKSTNNLLKNIDWAKKGIFSFSKKPLNILTMTGTILIIITILLALGQTFSRIFAPLSAPKGITTVMLLIMFFGSFTIFSISLLGEYIAKIFEEVKARPHYIRKNIIKGGAIISLNSNVDVDKLCNLQ